MNASCLERFALRLSDTLALPNRNDHQLVRNVRRAETAFQANNPLKSNESLWSSSFLLDKAQTLLDKAFDLFLLAVILTVLFSITLVYIILSFELQAAIVLTIVLLAGLMITFWSVSVLFTQRISAPTVNNDLLLRLERNRLNAAFCAYANNCRN